MCKLVLEIALGSMLGADAKLDTAKRGADLRDVCSTTNGARKSQEHAVMTFSILNSIVLLWHTDKWILPHSMMYQRSI